MADLFTEEEKVEVTIKVVESLEKWKMVKCPFFYTSCTKNRERCEAHCGKIFTLEYASANHPLCPCTTNAKELVIKTFWKAME